MPSVGSHPNSSLLKEQLKNFKLDSMHLCQKTDLNKRSTSRRKSGAWAAEDNTYQADYERLQIELIGGSEWSNSRLAETLVSGSEPKTL